MYCITLYSCTRNENVKCKQVFVFVSNEEALKKKKKPGENNLKSVVTKCTRHNKRRKFYRSVIQMLMIFLQDLLNHLYLCIYTRFPNEQCTSHDSCCYVPHTLLLTTAVFTVWCRSAHYLNNTNFP